MSEDNVEVVRRMFEAYRSGDNEAALAAFDPMVEFDSRARPEGRVYMGREGVAEATRTWVGTWDDWSFEIEEIVDAGDQVFVAVRESGRGKGSGVVTEHEVFSVFTLRDATILHWTSFLDRTEALKAAGLSE